MKKLIFLFFMAMALVGCDNTTNPGGPSVKSFSKSVYVISFTLLNDTTAIPTGVLDSKKSVPITGVVTAVRIISVDGTTGNLTVDVLADTKGTNPEAADSITNSNPAVVSSDDYVEYTPSGWTTTVVTDSQWLSLEIEGTPTLTDVRVEIEIEVL